MIKKKNDVLLSINDGNYYVANFALKHINIDINRGDIVGIIGKNGAGKTTLLNLLAGIYIWKKGNIIRNVTNVGYCFDDLSVPMDLNIRELKRIFKKLIYNWDSDFFEFLLKKLKLPQDKPCKTFSKGMKMQLNVAITLSHHAELLILDEVTAGLDILVRRNLINLVFNYSQKYNVPIVLTTHNLADVANLCTKFVLVNNGKVKLKEKTEHQTGKDIEKMFYDFLENENYS